MEDSPSDYIYKTKRSMNSVFIYKHNKLHFYAVRNLAYIWVHDNSKFHQAKSVIV